MQAPVSNCIAGPAGTGPGARGGRGGIDWGGDTSGYYPKPQKEYAKTSNTRQRPKTLNKS